MTNQEFYHHGVKGQKWGVRRYRNKDGSLTSLGKKLSQRKAARDIYLSKYKNFDKHITELDSFNRLRETSAKTRDVLAKFNNDKVVRDKYEHAAAKKLIENDIAYLKKEEQRHKKLARKGGPESEDHLELAELCSMDSIQKRHMLRELNANKERGMSPRMTAHLTEYFPKIPEEAQRLYLKDKHNELMSQHIKAAKDYDRTVERFLDDYMGKYGDKPLKYKFMGSRRDKAEARAHTLIWGGE